MSAMKWPQYSSESRPDSIYAHLPDVGRSDRQLIRHRPSKISCEQLDFSARMVNESSVLLCILRTPMPCHSPNHLRRLASLLSASTLALISPSLAQEEPAPAPAQKDPALEKYYVANGVYNRKLYPVAIQQYEAFLKEHPDHEKADLARRGLALSHYASKQYKEAIPPLAALLAKEKLDPSISRERLVMMHGQCLLITGEKDKAKELYVAELAALKTAAYQSAALGSICDVSFGNAKWDEVVSWSTKLLAGKPSAAQQARALYQQGYAHYQLKDPKAALTSLSAIKGLEADKVWLTRAMYLVGECHNQLKQYAEAEAAFEVDEEED